MSLAINVDKVKEVLLSDGWHKVYKDNFDIDSYEFVYPGIIGKDGRTKEGIIVHSGGSSGITDAGFRFAERISPKIVANIEGPLTAILAVKRY